MAFDTPTETWASDLTKSLDDVGRTTRVATRILEAVSDDPTNDNENTAEGAFPLLYAAHPRLGTAYILRNVKIKRKSPILYEATCTYRTSARDDDSGGGDEPWNQPAVVYYYDITETGPTEFDANGDEIATVNGEPFPIPREYADQGIRIVKAFSDYDPAAFYLYRTKVNSDTFLGFPPGVLRVVGITGNPNKHENGTPYYDVEVNIAARAPINTTDEKAWYWRGPQKGYLVKDSASSNAKPYHACESGRPVNTPVFINEDGTKKSDTDAIYFLEKQRYETIAFSGMNLF